MTKDYMRIEDSIKHVAMYVRKSRADEGEKDLEGHMLRLKLRCEANNWSYELYKEIASGSSIDGRPVMQQLLKDVEDNLYDAVLVVDYDRLTRGSGGDNDRILYTMKVSNTLIVIDKPYTVLDPNDESDQESMYIQNFIAHFEYKKIIKRQREGKKIAQYKGQWVNSVPPYGYTVDRKTKKLTPLDDEAKVVLRIKDLFFEDKSTAEIAWVLNREGIKPRKAMEWRASRIGDILQNEVYVGIMVYNKSVGNRNKKDKSYNSTPFKKLPESEWKRIYNCHPPLFTESEFNHIQEYFKNSNYSHKGSRPNIYSLSGLCKTPDGKTLNVHQSKKGTKLYLITKANKFGEPTVYKGISYKLVEEYIYVSLQQLKDKLDKQLSQEINISQEEKLSKQLVRKEEELDLIMQSKNRIIEGFLAGLYDKSKSIELTSLKDKEIENKEIEIENLKEELNNLTLASYELKQTKMERVLKAIKEGKSHKDLNVVYKTIIKDIIVDRKTEDKIKLTINFL